MEFFYVRQHFSLKFKEVVPNESNAALNMFYAVLYCSFPLQEMQFFVDFFYRNLEKFLVRFCWYR